MPHTQHPAFRLRDLKAPIWRYQKIARVLELLKTGELYFARADTLGDPFEGSFSQASLAHLEGNHPSHIIMTLKASEGWRQICAVSCWHQNEDESAAMWPLYGRTSPAVAIRSSVDHLKRALAPAPGEIYLGEVLYIDYETVPISDQNLLYTLLNKRQSFAHEREIRAITVIPRHLRSEDPVLMPRGLRLPVDVPALVEALYVAPETTISQFDDIRRAVDDAGYVSIPVRKSRLDELPRF